MNLDIKKVVKPLACALIGGGLAMALGENGPSDVVGMDVTASTAIGVGCGVGNLVAEYAKPYVTQYIPDFNVSTQVIDVALNFAGALAFAKLNGNATTSWGGMGYVLGYSAISQVATDYLAQNYL